MFELKDFNAPLESRSLYLRPCNFWIRYQIRPENEFWYGDCGYITGATSVKMYTNTVIPIGTVVLIPTAVLMFNTVAKSYKEQEERHMEERR